VAHKVDNEEKPMWRRERWQGFLETSRKDDHVPWPARSLETSRRGIHLALAKKTSRMCPCAPLLTYILDYMFCYLHCNPF